MAVQTDYDVVIVGGGHNALVAATYLATSGYRTVVLERLAQVGGAAVSEEPWPGVTARLSRYSYLVSLFPQRIIDDLGLSLPLRRRRYSSYTPDPSNPTRGILVDGGDERATAESFTRTTGDRAEAARFAQFYDALAPVARRVFATVTEPLPRESELRASLDPALWDALTARPLGELIERSLTSDLARGIALTDGLIGTFARSDDASLAPNRCFLYHVIGGGTGDWDVPVGGMGTVSRALERAARAAGAEIRTGVTVASVTPDGIVETEAGGTVRGRLVLSGVGPAVLHDLLRTGGVDAGEAPRPEGAQLKVNMLLTRLPRLRDTVDPVAAFSGTFHINETMSQLDAGYDAAASGRLPDPLPAEVYCHSLTDPSILSPALQAQGAQTLTLFGLHVPHRLVANEDPDGVRERLLAAAERSLDSVLAEPIANCLATTASGEACIEARTTSDLERSLAMRGGDIFHGALDWPWAENSERIDSPAQRWGVATAHDGILVCGSGARRGGAVSGIAGHNAAMAAREILER